MSYRRRLMLLAALAVALAVAMASVATYVLVRAQLRDSVDDGLRSLSARVGTAPEPRDSLQRRQLDPEEERREFLLLLRNPDQVLPRDMIYERVWGHDISATSNSLDVYVGYLRRKTEERGEPRLIHTVRGVGFRLGT